MWVYLTGDIDEHFRRSLAKYAAVQPRPSPPPFDGSVRVVSSSSQPQSPTSSPPVSPSASSDTNRMRSLTVANSPPRPMKRASPSAEAQLSGIIHCCGCSLALTFQISTEVVISCCLVRRVSRRPLCEVTRNGVEEIEARCRFSFSNIFRLRHC
jgi:hypothetical protein